MFSFLLVPDLVHDLIDKICKFLHGVNTINDTSWFYFYRKTVSCVQYLKIYFNTSSYKSQVLVIVHTYDSHN